MQSMSLAQFIVHLEQAAVAVHEATHHALESAAQVVEKEAKAEIGHYQAAAPPFTAWPELADATKDDRVRHGFSENEPLLRTGDMRDSIHHKVEMTGIAQGEAHIGSDDPKALWQEVGTSRIPPRSFLGGALVRKTHEVRAICGQSAVHALVGKGLPKITI